MGFLNSILLLFLIIFPVAVAATNALRQGDVLDYELVSASGKFTLGVYGLGSNSYAQSAYYLAIWYTGDLSFSSLVWIANPGGIPLFTGGQLIIDESGSLKFIDNVTNKKTMFNIYISNKVASGKGNNTVAVLEDSGNFVLYDNTTGNIQVLWQSFDHPTHTLLPGMKLGYNHTTRQNWILTSWLRGTVPASGAFTLHLEHINNSHSLVIYRHGNVYWTSDSWIEEDGGLGGSGSFKFGDTIVNGYLVSDDSSMYFAIHNKNIGVRSMMRLSYVGELMGELLEDGQNDVLTPSSCYGYAYDGTRNYGCAKFAWPKCRDKYDGFELDYGSWSGHKIHSDANLNISLSDCLEICWKDCNCRGFSIIDHGTGPLNTPVKDNPDGCYTFGVNADFNPYMPTYRRNILIVSGVLRSQKLPKENKPKARIWIVSAAIVVPLLFAAFLYYMWIRKRRLEETRRYDKIHQLTGSDSFNYGDELVKGIKDAPDVNIFSLEAISAATHNFSNNNKLGQGGYGPVYKGILFDGRQIAVKRLSKTSGQGIEEFKNELILISKLQHTNLVRLYGCCINQEEKMLIYEFMPNKSLDFFLFAADTKKLDWPMRYNIIEGVAQGLLYLHKYSRTKVIHRDLKVSNILLDENMNPKIADFGLARIFKQNMTEEITKRIAGTRGYMAPEYAMRGTFSIKSDVYSYGVLILEIVSGEKISKFYSLDKALNLLGYAWELWKGGTPLDLKDESLGESCDLNQLLRTIHVALLCVQEKAYDRPTILEVISMLNNEITNLPNPKHPAFFTGTPLDKETDYLSDKNIPASINQLLSINGLTITTMGAR